MFGAFYFGQPYFADGAQVTSSGTAGSGIGYASGRVTISATGKISTAPFGWSSDSVTLRAGGLLRATGLAYSVASVHVSLQALLKGSGIARADARVTISASGFLIFYPFGYASGGAALIPYGIIRVPQDLLVGDMVHYSGPSCPGDNYSQVMAISKDKSQIRVLVTGIGRWIWTRDVRSAVRPTKPDARETTSILDPVGFRTHL